MTSGETILLRGKPVVDALQQHNRSRVEQLASKGIVPQIALVRVGDNPDDCSYERMAVKRAESLGVRIAQYHFPQDATQEELINAIQSINENDAIHGCLMFRPLPNHLDEQALCELLDPKKDIDGITSAAMAGVYAGSDIGFPPCTAQACLEILDFYGINISGSRVSVIGRSLVIGRPVALLLMNRNATVTLCHSRTEDLARSVKDADIVVCASGRARAYGRDIFQPNQVVIDVGINFDESNRLCGDVDFDAVCEFVHALTPVPGGVGGVTTAVLMSHVIDASYRKINPLV